MNTLSDQVLAFLKNSKLPVAMTMTAEEIWEALSIPHGKRILPCHVRQALARGLFVRGLVAADTGVRVVDGIARAEAETRWCLLAAAPACYLVFDPMVQDARPIEPWEVGRW